MTRKYIQIQLDEACKKADFDEVKKWGAIRRDNTNKLLIHFGRPTPIDHNRCLRDYLTQDEIDNTEVG